MRAWHLTATDGPDSYAIADIPEPEPGPGEVRVRIAYSALNHLDLWVSRGLPAPKSFPHIGGADAAGVVDALGEGVTGFSVGDEVIVNPSMSCGDCRHCRNDDIVYCDRFGILGEHLPGTFTEKIVIPIINAVRKPEAMPWEVAGSFGLVTATALRMLERARLQSGDTLLVVGVGGGVSAAAMLLGLALGAHVYVTSRSERKISWAMEHGAKGGFDSSGEFGDEMTALGGADVMVESVGPATLRQSMRAVRRGGRIAVCGGTSGARFELSIPSLFYRQIELIGSSMATRAQFARATTWVGSGRVESPVDRVFDFEELPAALSHLDSGDQIGKVVIRHPR